MSKAVVSSFLGVCIGLVLALQPLMAQKTISNFTLDNSDQEKKVNLSDFKDNKAVVVVFTSSHCAWATKYEERLKKLHESFKDKNVSFIAINSNDATMSQRDAVARMREITPYPFPYLKDSDQKVAKQLGATKNPEAIVLIPRQGVFQVAYRGKIDDNPLDEKLVKHDYLSDAIVSVIEGKKPEIASTTISGCNIKWK